MTPAEAKWLFGTFLGYCWCKGISLRTGRQILEQLPSRLFYSTLLSSSENETTDEHRYTQIEETFVFICVHLWFHFHPFRVSSLDMNDSFQDLTDGCN